MSDEDPDITWLRHQVDQVFDGVPPTRTVNYVGLVTASAAGVALLSLLIGLALIMPL